MVPTVDDATTGDLAFFHNDDGRIVHVGIVLEQQRILHASGRVRVDKLDSTGIWDQAAARHSHRLHSIRRMF